MRIKDEEALRYHSMGKPGKIEVTPTKPHSTQKDLSLAYSPGVAVPCLKKRLPSPRHPAAASTATHDPSHRLIHRRRLIRRATLKATFSVCSASRARRWGLECRRQSSARRVSGSRGAVTGDVACGWCVRTCA